MRELKLNKAPGLKVVLESGEYVMRRPNVGESRDMDERLRAGKESSVDIMCEMLAVLGMPLDVSRSLDQDQMELLIESLIAPTKKKA